jgi:hypothetical protein
MASENNHQLKPQLNCEYRLALRLLHTRVTTALQSFVCAGAEAGSRLFSPPTCRRGWERPDVRQVFWDSFFAENPLLV